MASFTSWVIDVAAVLMIVLIKEVESETCPVYTNNVFAGYQSCGNGCCGRYPNYYCCDISSAAVAGIVLGGIVVVCFLVFLCAFCMKKKTQPGRVVRPVQPAASNTIVFTGASGRYPTAPQVPMPPPYKQYDSPPPYTANPGRNQYGGQPNPASTQAYPYGTRPMGAGGADPSAAPPPEYSSRAAPPSSTSAFAPQQYSYGQGHGWSEGGVANPSVAPPAQATPSAATPSVRATAPNQSSIGPTWSESALNRNTITTRNFPSRLPPLPND